MFKLELTFSAALFKDEIMKKKILESKNPMEQKKCGRQVQNFDENVWNAHCDDIVREASVAKVIKKYSMLTPIKLTMWIINAKVVAVLMSTIQECLSDF